jgi:hypothetical protein
MGRRQPNDDATTLVWTALWAIDVDQADCNSIHAMCKPPQRKLESTSDVIAQRFRQGNIRAA